MARSTAQFETISAPGFTPTWRLSPPYPEPAAFWEGPVECQPPTSDYLSESQTN